MINHFAIFLMNQYEKTQFFIFWLKIIDIIRGTRCLRYYCLLNDDSKLHSEDTEKVDIIHIQLVQNLKLAIINFLKGFFRIVHFFFIETIIHGLYVYFMASLTLVGLGFNFDRLFHAKLGFDVPFVVDEVSSTMTWELIFLGFTLNRLANTIFGKALQSFTFYTVGLTWEELSMVSVAILIVIFSGIFLCLYTASWVDPFWLGLAWHASF